MKPLILSIFLLGSILPACCCCSIVPFLASDTPYNAQPAIQRTPTSTSRPPNLTPQLLAPTRQPITSPQPPSRPTTFPTSTKPPTETPSEISPAINVVVNVPSILGRTTTEIESILGSTIAINPINDPFDSLSGGEYRDYLIGRYLVFIGYDENGIARMFQVLEGLESSDYSIREWNQILPIFGMHVSTSPSRTASAGVYWDNYNGYFIAVVASSSSGSPVWTVQIAQAAYAP